MMSGTMLGQVCSVLLVPISSRIYGAQLYGDLAVFASLASICTGLFGFGLASSIMVEKTDYEAEQTYKFAIYSTNVLVIFLAFIILILKPVAVIIETSLPYHIVIILLAFTIMTTNHINMLYAWLNRKGKYNIMLFNPVITPLANNGLAILLGLIGFKAYGLYIGATVAQVITLIHMFVNMDKMTYRIKLCDVKPIIERNKDFILYQYPASLINTTVGNIPVQVLSYCFGNVVVGYYSMAMKLISIPSNILSSSMSRVYFKEATERQSLNGTARQYTYGVSKKISYLYIIPMLIILIGGDLLVPLFLGNEWLASVPYLKIVAILNLFAIGVNCTSGFTSVIGRQKINLIMSIVKLVVFPLFMIGTSKLFNNPEITVCVFSLAYSIVNTIYYEFLLREEKSLKNKYMFFMLFLAGICLLFYLSSLFLGILK